MKLGKKKGKISILFFIIVLYNINSTIIFACGSEYTKSIENGTQILEVSRYDEQSWIVTINSSSNPTNWFRGDSDKVKAQSKITIYLCDYRDEINSYEIFKWLISKWYGESVFSILNNNGYNYSYFVANYPGYYIAWSYYYNFWPFGTEPFNNISDYLSERSYIFKDPSSFTKLLADYNNFTHVVNNDLNLIALNISLDTMDASEFLWRFAINGFTLASPISNYLAELSNMIEWTKVQFTENKIIFNRTGITSYIVEMSYNSNGNLETVTVKDTDNEIIYEIISIYPKIIVYIIIVSVVTSVSIIFIMINFFLKKKRLREIA